MAAQRIAYRSRNGCELPEASAHANVVGIDHFAVDPDFLSFDTDIGDPVLAATIGAAGDVEFQLLIETGDAFLEFGGQPAREAFGFREREFAVFRAGASHRAAGEGRSFDGESGFGQRGRNLRRIGGWDIRDQQILHHGGAHAAIAVAIGEIRRDMQLLRGDASTRDRRADIGKARLALRVDAGVIAVHIHRKIFRLGRVE